MITESLKGQLEITLISSLLPNLGQFEHLRLITVMD